MEGSFDQALSAFGLAVITYRSNGYLVYDQMNLYTERLRRNRLEQRWLDVIEAVRRSAEGGATTARL